MVQTERGKDQHFRLEVAQALFSFLSGANSEAAQTCCSFSHATAYSLPTVNLFMLSWQDGACPGVLGSAARRVSP